MRRSETTNLGNEVKTQPKGKGGYSRRWPDTITEFGNLKPDTFIYKKDLACILGKSIRSIDRSIRRGDLPPPAPFAGRKGWTVRKLRSFIDDSLTKAEAEFECLQGEFDSRLI